LPREPVFDVRRAVPERTARAQTVRQKLPTTCTISEITAPHGTDALASNSCAQQ